MNTTEHGFHSNSIASGSSSSSSNNRNISNSNNMDNNGRDMLDIRALRRQIRGAISEQSQRGLIDSSKWLGEQLAGLVLHMSMNELEHPRSPGVNPLHSTMMMHQGRGRTTASSIVTEGGYAEDLLDMYEFAKGLFDQKEFLRCAHVLDPCIQQRDQLQHELDETEQSIFLKCLFLKYYALFLAGENRKEEEILELHGSLEQVGTRDNVENKYVRSLYNDLRQCHQSGYIDAYLMFLYGAIAHKMGFAEESVNALEHCVAMEPTLWCAWMELASLNAKKQQDGNREDSEFSTPSQNKFPTPMSQPSFLSLPQYQPSQASPMYRIMQRFFHAHLAVESQDSENALQILTGPWLSVFSQSTYVQGQVALAYYNAQDFDTAQHHFETLYQTRDPYRFDQLDIFSNILYVKEAKAELSLLAHEMITRNKYRPETCCVVGNYYSIRGDHEKAIMYFKRALKLDRHYLSAWTLMGHEYVELKNTAAAVHAYRTAVEINPRDYRALYGLGQTYEVLNMHIYALYYYSRATQLRQNDGRMWIAMAQCYEQLDKYDMAVTCYQRASDNNDPEGIALQKLSELYEMMGLHDEADSYRHLYHQTLSNEVADDEQARWMKQTAFGPDDGKN